MRVDKLYNSATLRAVSALKTKEKLPIYSSNGFRKKKTFKNAFPKI